MSIHRLHFHLNVHLKDHAFIDYFACTSFWFIWFFIDFIVISFKSVVFYSVFLRLAGTSVQVQPVFHRVHRHLRLHLHDYFSCCGLQQLQVYMIFYIFQDVIFLPTKNVSSVLAKVFFIFSIIKQNTSTTKILQEQYET